MTNDVLYLLESYEPQLFSVRKVCSTRIAGKSCKGIVTWFMRLPYGVIFQCDHCAESLAGGYFKRGRIWP